MSAAPPPPSPHQLVELFRSFEEEVSSFQRIDVTLCIIYHQ